MPYPTCFSRILFPICRTTSPLTGAGVSAHAIFAFSISPTCTCLPDQHVSVIRAGLTHQGQRITFDTIDDIKVPCMGRQEHGQRTHHALIVLHSAEAHGADDLSCRRVDLPSASSHEAGGVKGLFVIPATRRTQLTCLLSSPEACQRPSKTPCSSGESPSSVRKA